MDTTQEELVAALIRRLQGKGPVAARRPAGVAAGLPAEAAEVDVVIDPDEDVIELG